MFQLYIGQSFIGTVYDGDRCIVSAELEELERIAPDEVIVDSLGRRLSFYSLKVEVSISGGGCANPVRVSTHPTFGALTRGTDGIVSYDPHPREFYGEDRFAICQGGEGLSEVQVTISRTPPYFEPGGGPNFGDK